jgi:serine/threonine protein kinase
VDTRDWALNVPIGYRAGDYTVHRAIAAGSFAGVYEGRDGDVRVALKFLPTGTLTPRQLKHLRQMVDKETTAHQRLAHPRVITLRESFTLDDPSNPELDGAAVLVMDLAAGTAADLPRPVPERVIHEICEGLAHVHAEGWVHGDIKPSNILIMEDGSARLGDFGLTTELDGTHAYAAPIGSLDYMQPARRSAPLSEEGSVIRPADDVWALGITACLLLTGHHPFTGANPRARAIAAQDFVDGRGSLSLDGLSEHWRAWITDCLTGRTTSAALLDRLTPGGPDTGRRHHRPSLRRRLGLIAVATAVAFSAGAWFWWPADEPADRRYAHWLKADTDIPATYRRQIVAAGTSCEQQGVTPALVAAILKVESGFDASLADPVAGEYGIARWTPLDLQRHLPADERDKLPVPPYDAGESIAALGRFLCRHAGEVSRVPGDVSINLAAAYRTSPTLVRNNGGVPESIKPYADQIQQALAAYRP